MTDFIATLSDRFKEAFDPAQLADMLTKGILNLTVGFIIATGFYLLWRLVRMGFRHGLKGRMDTTSYAFVETIVKFSLLAIGAITALDSVGVKTSALLASLGVAGLTIGFAARDALSNIISGILIFIDRPFVLGDLVEIDGHYGRVDRITLRSTRVVTPNGRMLAVPNTVIINKTVASYTNFPNFRVEVGVTVGVNEDLDSVRSVLLSLLKDDAAFMVEPAARVVVTALNDYNVAMELQAWIHDERLHVAKTFELREKVFNILTRAGVEMPVETLDIRQVKVSQPDEQSAPLTKERQRDHP